MFNEDMEGLLKKQAQTLVCAYVLYCNLEYKDRPTSHYITQSYTVTIWSLYLSLLTPYIDMQPNISSYVNMHVQLTCPNFKLSMYIHVCWQWSPRTGVGQWISTWARKAFSNLSMNSGSYMEGDYQCCSGWPYSSTLQLRENTTIIATSFWHQDCHIRLHTRRVVLCTRGVHYKL